MTTKPKRPDLSDPQTVVTIIIGLDTNSTPAATFIIHKELLCYYSPVFDTAFNGDFLEGRSQSMRLGDVEPKVFGLLVDWVYSEYIRDEVNATLMEYAKLWTLADRFIMPKLQNAAMENIFCALVMAKPHDIVEFSQYVYVTSAIEDTMLKRVAITRVAFRDLDEVEEFIGELPKEMLIQVTKQVYVRLEHLQRNIKPREDLEAELSFRNFLVGNEAHSKSDIGAKDTKSSGNGDVAVETAETRDAQRGRNLGWSINGEHLATLT